MNGYANPLKYHYTKENAILPIYIPKNSTDITYVPHLHISIKFINCEMFYCSF